MFGPFERAVAGRYLRARRGERFVSVIAGFSLVGIALGVATLIIVMSVMGGFKTDLLNRILGFNGDLGVYGAGQPLTAYAADAAKIRTVPGVLSAIPVVDGQVLITNDHGGNTGGYVRGIGQTDLESLRSVSDHILAGSLDAFKGPDAIAVGITLANRFGLTAGDKITLVSPQGAATAFGTIPRVRAYTIAAIFQVGMNEYDSGYVFIPLEAAQVFFQQPNQATQIEVQIADPDVDHPGCSVQRRQLADHDGEGQDPRYRRAAHHRRRARRGAAHLPHGGRLRGRDRHRAGHAAGRGVLPQYRAHPGLGGGADRADRVRPDGLLPGPSPRPAGLARGGADHRHGAGAVVAGDALPFLARRPDRPGRSVAECLVHRSSCEG